MPEAASEPEAILRIDDGVCQGHGRCYSLAPDLFEWSPDNDHGRVIVSVMNGATLKEAQRIVAECPERAISLTPVPPRAASGEATDVDS